MASSSSIWRPLTRSGPGAAHHRQALGVREQPGQPLRDRSRLPRREAPAAPAGQLRAGPRRGAATLPSSWLASCPRLRAGHQPGAAAPAGRARRSRCRPCRCRRRTASLAVDGAARVAAVALFVERASGDHPALRADRGERAGRRGHLPPPGRPAAGHRAGRGPGASACRPQPLLARLERRLPLLTGGRGPAGAAADAARHDRLEL